MVMDFRHMGTIHKERERLKMFVNTSANWSAQACSTRPCTPSGPAAFLMLMLLSALRTSCVCRTRGCEFPVNSSQAS